MSHASGRARDETEGPQLTDASATIQDEEHEEGNEEAEDPGQVPHVGGHLRCLGAAELAGGSRGNSHRTEADVDCIADDRDDGRLDLRHAQGDQHRAGDGHGGSEARQPLEQAAEAESDDESLGALVAPPDRVKDGLQVGAAPRLLGQVVQPHRSDDDVDDRHESHRGALRASQQRQVDGHVKGEDRDDERERESDDRAPVGRHLEHAHEDEEDDERKKPHDGGEEDVSRDGRRRWGKELGD